MFANMGSSGGGGGGGKPSGGTGGLWKRNPATGKREPGMGYENAPPPAGGERAQRDAGAPKPAEGTPKPAAAATTDASMRQQGLITDKQMTQDERTSLQWYNANGHDRINAELRGTAPVRDQATLDRTTRNLDSIMARSRLRTEAEVHRGTLLETPEAQQMAARWQPGATFRDNGYVSTTVSRRVAEDFGADVEPAPGVQTVAMRIRVPPGTSAIYMPTARPLSRADEQELLLNRGLNYRVLSRTESGGRITLDLEVVP